MTLREALSCAQKALTAQNIEDAPLESELLLRYALNISRVQLYLDLNSELTAEQEAAYRQLVKRRLNHEPTVYITGQCEFYGLDFYVDSRVLIPRSGTELLVEEALKVARRRLTEKESHYLIAEVGVGSGIIAITLARHLPHAKIYATDISTAALEVAAINCRRHKVDNRVALLAGDLLTALPEPVDLIVANLPYITEDEMKGLSPEIQLFEPRMALAGGKDGLDEIRRLCRQAKDRLYPRGNLLLEIGLGQSHAMSSFLGGLYPAAVLQVVSDWNDIDRVISLTLPPSRLRFNRSTNRVSRSVSRK